MEPEKRAYVKVIDYIKQEIRVGNLRIGARLPPERALAERLNVSRNSVREALRILEIMGTTTSTQGAGHFIAANFESTLVETMSIMFLLKELSFQQVSPRRGNLVHQAQKPEVYRRFH
ncbi:MAG: FadR family transcriptional regulator [Oscillibacter sp.]|nr:FadR family transcriptional regulator [Oscillibacter sp.]